MNMFSLIPTTAEMELGDCGGTCMGCDGCYGCEGEKFEIKDPPPIK